MISDGEKEEIRSLLKTARNRPLSFGICLAEKPVETVFLMHRQKIPAALGREAKAEGKGSRFARGTIQVEGTSITLNCEGKVPSGLAKNLKKYLKLLKLTYKVAVVDNWSAAQKEEQEQEAADAAAETQGSATDNAAPQETPDETPEVPAEQARYEALAEELTAQIEEIDAQTHPKAAKIAAIWSLGQQRAESGDYATAIKALTSLQTHL
ncbi:MAG: hypothetical protein AB8B60_05030 [Sulfitobacter sp.]